MFEYSFFRIFELLIIAAILYGIWRLVKADAKAIKRKIDSELGEDEKKQTKVKDEKGDTDGTK
jgi:hypothetical protein